MKHFMSSAKGLALATGAFFGGMALDALAAVDTSAVETSLTAAQTSGEGVGTKVIGVIAGLAVVGVIIGLVRKV